MMRHILLADDAGRILCVSKGPGDSLSGLEKAWKENNPNCIVAYVDKLPVDFSLETHAYIDGKIIKKWNRKPSLEERIERIEKALLRTGLLKER